MIRLADIRIPGIPPSVNSIYVHTRTSTRLDPKVVEYRKTVREFLERSGWLAQLRNLSPQPLSCYLLFSSPQWWTQEGRIASKDLDNRIKACLDAIEDAVWPKRRVKRGQERPVRPEMGFRDEWLFQIFSEKLSSHEVYTRVVLTTKTIGQLDLALSKPKGNA